MNQSVQSKNDITENEFATRILASGQDEAGASDLTTRGRGARSSLACRFRAELDEFWVLLDNVPAVTLTFFVLAVFSMNLMANKSIDLAVPWLALDCGILVSWVASLAMDMLTKHFGPKAATEISLYATVVNLIGCLFFFLLSLIPGTWSASFVPGSQQIIGSALDQTFGGTWFIILGSTIAFTASSAINNFINFSVGKAFKRHPNGLGAYLMRSYVSTFVAQFADNFLFAFIVSRTFFGWTLVQCVTCSFFGMLVELLCEAVFSVMGYRICNRWQRKGVGEAYFDYLKTHGAGRLDHEALAQEELNLEA